jgi:hypothetical protein
VELWNGHCTCRKKNLYKCTRCLYRTMKYLCTTASLSQLWSETMVRKRNTRETLTQSASAVRMNVRHTLCRQHFRRKVLDNHVWIFHLYIWIPAVCWIQDLVTFSLWRNGLRHKLTMTHPCSHSRRSIQFYKDIAIPSLFTVETTGYWKKKN